MPAVRKEIWKYDIRADATVVVQMPKGAQVLSVVNQNDGIVVYALVDTLEKKTEGYTFVTIGTGYEVDINTSVYRFVGTVVTNQGKRVWHVFMRGEEWI
jgi:hypothetical protein